ncbi:MAG: hypothetical protein JRH20_26175 [Deltaproteobacteria bacterium]|nr:hypothetical protein [Deltaproteobacteria bacterium]
MGTCSECGGRMVDSGVERNCLDCGAVEVNHRAMQARRRKALRTGLFSVLGLIGMTGVCAVGVWLSAPNAGEAEGHLVLTGGPLGSVVFQPSQCFGGERIVGYDFRGIALLGTPPDTKMIRIVDNSRNDGQGHEVILATRGAVGEPWKELSLTNANCPSLRVELARSRPAHTHHQSRDLYKGSLSADCTLPKGGKVKSLISFGTCRCDPHMEKRSVE